MPGIAYTRIDGKTPFQKRSEAMSLFQKEARLRVVLVTITCGIPPYFSSTSHLPIPFSLDLTAASRTYLLEPHWNPMIEEQALCREHRVGQTRNVTTIRYLMRNSFEEVLKS
jgi:SWI/SNF-related matrix-associated actin-dependent regulator of chromatin subfamily A3